MLSPIKLVDIELSKPIEDVGNLSEYVALKGIVRLHGFPLGYIQVPVRAGACKATEIGKEIINHYSWPIIDSSLRNGLSSSKHPENLDLDKLLKVPPPPESHEWPLVTVVVCTRDRPEDIDRCLAAINKLDYPALDVLVVDNAPATNATKEILEQRYPQFRYICEPRPGLDWARNRGIIEARGDIIAYTDDDVVVDPSWVKAIARAFIEDPSAMALTGLVVPYELETEAQVLFEIYGGFGRGFERKEYQVSKGKKVPWTMLGTGQFGTGANMAYRRSVFESIGYFDPALDVGTQTNGGGDLEMFFRVIKEGYKLVYEPKAMIRHRHRPGYDKLKQQIFNNGSLYAYFIRSVQAYPDQTTPFLKLALWWMFYWNIRRLINYFFGPGDSLPQELIWVEFVGGFVGMTTYQKASKRAKEIEKSFGPQRPETWDTELSVDSSKTLDQDSAPAEDSKTETIEPDLQSPTKKPGAIAVREIDLSQPLSAIDDAQEYELVRIFARWKDLFLGQVDISNPGPSISVATLASTLVDNFGTKLVEPRLNELPYDVRWSNALQVLSEAMGLGRDLLKKPMYDELPDDVPVSIVIATFDRPDDLRNCLTHLRQQNTSRPVEIVVVDNHPSSGLTPPIVRDFPEVVLIKEQRQGLAYARNAGFLAATGHILIATDDDVTVSDDWIEKISAPFARPDVMIVTGNVLPIELENPCQQDFEVYGGLGRGYEPFEVNYDWFKSQKNAVPTWRLGATANAAFRATIITHPQIGLMEETLGPGMPSGVGEDTYLFYKTLKAGYTLVYEPNAYVWHKHRQTTEALRRQIFGYSKGHVSYNLTTWIKDRDWRGLKRVFIDLPMYHHIPQMLRWMRGNSGYPISLSVLELWGNLVAPWSLWKSYQRVRREGRSRA